VTVETMVSDAVIWATYLLIVIGGAALVTSVVVWVLGQSGQRFTPATARVAIRRIVGIALVAFAVVFVAGAIVGLLQG
jgi:hypothetical protein